MPVIEFDKKNKSVSNVSFPKLKLKKDEKARIVLLEDPTMEFVHDLRMPQILNGVPQREIKTRQDGGEYETYVMDFVGRYVSLGDFGTLLDKGSDPDNCPMSKEAQISDRVDAPRARYAMHVIQYATQPGTGNITEPFSVSTIVWAFTSKVFDKITDLKEEWGDLRKHDLILTCTNTAFQQFDISVTNKAEWMQDAARKKLTADTFKNNRAQDLSYFCGRTAPIERINEELAKIRRAWDTVNGTASVVETTPSATASVGGTFDEGLDDLLGNSTAGPASSGETVSFDDLAGEGADDILGDIIGDTASDTPKAKTVTKAKPAKVEEPAAESDELDLDFLNNL